ncbi:MAG: hypothetical protein GYB53_17935 [Rhodobacteraceae bacterium]|nr:hypothetical protein [Paracoccaceae bacterium]MBR9821918.1 hypothetical protein [Paracoccaceae bacterium]
MSDPYATETPTSSSLGSKGAVIVPADDTDLDPVAKAVTVLDTTAGADLVILPKGNADGKWLTYSGVSVGFTTVHAVRRVGVGTTCTVASVDG